MQWGFYFDQTRCVNCRTCVLACKAWNHEKRGDYELHPEFGEYHMKENWRRILVEEYGDCPPDIGSRNLSVSCNHCENPACVKACPTERIYKEDRFGLVLYNEEIPCISCRKCQKACPWESPRFYDESPYFERVSDRERPAMTKCSLCMDRIEDGKKPACVAACITRALDAGPIEELEEKYKSKYGESVRRSEESVKPNLIIREKKI